MNIFSVVKHEIFQVIVGMLLCCFECVSMEIKKGNRTPYDRAYMNQVNHRIKEKVQEYELSVDHGLILKF